MELHKQFLQLGITSVLLLVITLYALYNHSFEMAFAGVLMLLISLAPFYFKAAHNVYVPAVFMYYKEEFGIDLPMRRRLIKGVAWWGY